MYEELIKRLRDIARSDGNIKSNYIGLSLLQAADAIEDLFAELRMEKVDNINLTGQLVVENAKVPLNVVIQTIKDMPSADVVERKKGEWFDRGSLSCRCSNCGCKANKEYSFCPNCGADMRGERDDKNI